LKIKCIVLKHPDNICKELKGIEYQREIDYIIQNERRNLFIKNLAGSLKNNTLILFQFIERHGDILFNLLQDLGGKKIFYIHGGTSPEDREAVRIYCENNSDTIILASYGVFSTGVNIKNLDNIIFALSGKSRIRNLQPIGRGLRLHDGKTHATLIDLSDDLRSGKYVNHSLKHLQERVKTYSSEKFHYKLIPINL
jgi:superfamily II DNA or RNA helicase